MRPRLPSRDRGTAAVLVVLVHAAAVLLVLGGRTSPVSREDAGLATFDVVPSPAPTPPHFERKPSPRTAAPAGRAGRTARRTPVVAPSPVAPLPAPILTASLPDTGSAPIGGASSAGIGTGAASGGSGSGAGGSGDGSGGGGTRARLLKGAIRNKDYPKAEREAKVEGTVTVAFTVGTNGRASGCRVIRSSGSGALDAVTCKLIVERFRYAPATDGAGRPVAEERGWQQRWWIADEPSP